MFGDSCNVAVAVAVVAINYSYTIIELRFGLRIRFGPMLMLRK